MIKTIFTFLFLISISYGQTNHPPKQDTSIYILIGKMPDFSLLYKAVATPKDVTPNQQEAILKWIQTIRKPETDTTHKK